MAAKYITLANRLKEQINKNKGTRSYKLPTEHELCELYNVSRQTVRLALSVLMEDGYIRLVVTRGKGDLGLNPRNCPKPSMFIIVQNIALYPAEMYENGLSMITSTFRRPNPDILCPQVKSLNYLNGISAKMEAVAQGAGEALMLNQRGNVAECTGDNIFIVRNGVVMTPPLTEGALGGITRHAVFDICAELGITCIEKVMNRFDVLSADECFLTGTAAEVIAATSLDGRKIGSGVAGPVTGRILARFRTLVRE